MKYGSIDITMVVIALVSILLSCSFSIARYKKREYNPLVFRLRQGSEWSVKDLVAYFGFCISSAIIQNYTLKGLAGFIGLLCFTTVHIVLNIKSYKLTKDRRIIIQTSILLVSITALLAFIFTI